MMEEFTPRPCDRCGCGVQSYEELNQQQPLCCEFQLGYGFIAWLCFECRRDWVGVFDASKLSEQYAEKAFELEFWNARIGESTPEGEFQNGLEHYRSLCVIEARIKN